MPEINFLIQQKLDYETKQELTAGLTEISHRVTGIKREHFIVRIIEVQDDYAVDFPEEITT